MDYKGIINQIEPELEKAISYLKRELIKIRSSRATPALVEDILVEYFGEKFSLKQLSSISIPGPREILIQPWDPSYLQPIIKTLERSGRGFVLRAEKEVVRVILPPLTQEYKEELIRLVSQKQEEARKTVRKWRDEAWSKIQQLWREGEISEDGKFKGKKELQKLVDEYMEKIKTLGEKKKKEIEG